MNFKAFVCGQICVTLAREASTPQSPTLPSTPTRPPQPQTKGTSWHLGRFRFLQAAIVTKGKSVIRVCRNDAAAADDDDDDDNNHDDMMQKRMNHT